MSTTDFKRRQVAGRGIPVPGNDIDTDRIIPARFLKDVTFEGMGEHAFEDARKQNPEHPFNRPRYQGASVLVVGQNFGCGSSREHAPAGAHALGHRRHRRRLVRRDLLRQLHGARHPVPRRRARPTSTGCSARSRSTRRRPSRSTSSARRCGSWAARSRPGFPDGARHQLVDGLLERDGRAAGGRRRRSSEPRAPCRTSRASERAGSPGPPRLHRRDVCPPRPVPARRLGRRALLAPRGRAASRRVGQDVLRLARSRPDPSSARRRRPRRPRPAGPGPGGRRAGRPGRAVDGRRRGDEGRARASGARAPDGSHRDVRGNRHQPVRSGGLAPRIRAGVPGRAARGFSGSGRTSPPRFTRWPRRPSSCGARPTRSAPSASAGASRGCCRAPSWSCSPPPATCSPATTRTSSRPMWSAISRPTEDESVGHPARLTRGARDGRPAARSVAPNAPVGYFLKRLSNARRMSAGRVESGRRPARSPPAA